MSKILVIGSEGTIGFPLCLALEKQGHEIYRADLQHRNYPFYTRCDISEYRQLYELIDGVSCDIDYIYFLAAEFGRINGEQYYEQLWKTNVIGTKNLLNILSCTGLDAKTIFFSSSEVYGELQTPSGFLSEENMLEYPVLQHNDYAISKWVNEKQIINAQKYNEYLKIFRIRLFNAYGPMEYYNDYRSVVCLFCYKMLHNLSLTIYKDYYRVFMYIDDLINTLCNIPKLEISEFSEFSWKSLNHDVINIGGKEYCSVEDMFNIVYNFIPSYSGVIEYLDKDGHNTVSKKPDISKAINLLRHNPSTKLIDGIPKTLLWMSETYKDTIANAVRI